MCILYYGLLTLSSSILMRLLLEVKNEENITEGKFRRRYCSEIPSVENPRHFLVSNWVHFLHSNNTEEHTSSSSFFKRFQNILNIIMSSYYTNTWQECLRFLKKVAVDHYAIFYFDLTVAVAVMLLGWVRHSWSRIACSMCHY